MRVPLLLLLLPCLEASVFCRLAQCPSQPIKIKFSVSRLIIIYPPTYLSTYPCAAILLPPPLDPSYSRDAAYPPAFPGHPRVHLITYSTSQIGHAAARC